MFERNALVTLRRWADNERRKPLIIRGARQVGKTTLIDSFSKEFENYLYLNLERNPSAIALFENEKPIDDMVADIHLYCNLEKREGRTLLFIDEIQQSKAAIAKLRYFFESNNPTLFVVAAGSLLETMLNKDISFPVGRVEYLALRPCTFTEFLRAIGESSLEKALIHQQLPEALHDKTIRLFNTFTLIGGMPEVIAHYAANKDFVALNAVYESLLTSYRDDVEKYARNEQARNMIRFVLQEGWRHTAERITLSGFSGSPYRSREMGETFRTLEKTFLLELCYPTSDVLVPFIKDMKRAPKLLWLDCGLVNYAAAVQREVFGAMDILDAWRGKIAEQVVGQELLAMDNRVSAQRVFWVRNKKGSEAEVDFLWQQGHQLVPIEVKSGHNAKLKSLHSFMEHSTHSTAIRVWSQPFSIDQVRTTGGKTVTLYNIPFYYVGQLDQLIR